MGWSQVRKAQNDGQADSRRKILIIDDDTQVTDMLRRFIGADDYRIFTGNNAAEGLKIYRQQKPQIIFTDVVMPGMSGIELLKTIRKNDEETEIIVLTGYQNLEVAIEALKNRASDFLLKPFEMEMIRLTLRKALERIALREQITENNKELKKLLNQVNYARNYLETIVKNSPDALMTYNSDGIITSWNEEAEHITGYSAAEAIGKKVEYIFSKEEQLILASAGSETSFKNIIAQILTKDDRLRYISRNANALFNEEKKIIGAIESFLDITDQLTNERLLEKRVLQVHTINEISKIVSRNNDLPEVIQFVLDSLHQTFFESSQLSVFLFNAQKQALDLAGTAGYQRESLDMSLNVSAAKGLLSRVFRKGKPLICEDISKLKGAKTGIWPEAQSIYIYPIRSGSRTFGLLNIENIEKAKADESDRSMLEAVSEFLGISMDRIELLERITRQNIQLEHQAADLRKALHKVEQQNNIIEKQNTRLIKDLHKAAEFQKSLLPEKLPQFARLKFAAIYIPSSQLGGDFYDVFKMDHNRVGIVLADASGHGVAAAMLSAMFKMTFQKYVSEMAEPAQVFNRLNRDFCKVLQMGEFFTAFYAVFDRRSGKLTYANAAHPRPVLLDYETNTLQELDTNGFLLGVMSDGISYEQKETVLNTRSRLLIYTDGVNESVNAQEEQFGSERIKTCLLKHAQEAPRSYLRHFKKELIRFSGTKNFDDDVSIIVMDVKNKGSR